MRSERNELRRLFPALTAQNLLYRSFQVLCAAICYVE
jgi:hypothetical protein